MPELPDITIYMEHLQERCIGQRLDRVRIASPFLLRTFQPPISAVEGKTVAGVQRIGKQIIIEIEGELFIVIHLMIAGRFHWKSPGAKVGGKINLAAFDFPSGTLMLTEASTKKRASLHLVGRRSALAEFNRGGIDILTAPVAAFGDAFRRENHTLKRSLTDQRLFSGIGNAYSDEILHRAKLSPLKLSAKLEPEEIDRLFLAVRSIMHEWIDRLRKETAEKFPEKVTAFRPEMTVHGKFGKPCPVCGTKVQRIRYAENECNYCPRCQTDGKLLRDRSLSRLLKDDWPSRIEDLEVGS